VEVKASARQIRVSPRKVGLVLDVVRGKKVSEALVILNFLRTPTARTVAKVVKSAAANAENNYQMVPAQLKIVKAFAEKGQSLRRFRASARGRASPYIHRYSHIIIIVEEE